VACARGNPRFNRRPDASRTARRAEFAEPSTGWSPSPKRRTRVPSALLDLVHEAYLADPRVLRLPAARESAAERAIADRSTPRVARPMASAPQRRRRRLRAASRGGRHDESIFREWTPVRQRNRGYPISVIRYVVEVGKHPTSTGKCDQRRTATVAAPVGRVGADATATVCLIR